MGVTVGVLASFIARSMSLNLELVGRYLGLAWGVFFCLSDPCLDLALLWARIFFMYMQLMARPFWVLVVIGTQLVLSSVVANGH